MTDFLKIACVQMNSGSDVGANLKAAEGLIRQAAAAGAEYILTPEVTDQVISHRESLFETSFLQDEHPGVAFFSSLAGELGVCLAIGSLCIKVSGDKVANRGFVFGADGSLLASYDKIHLYDVDLPCGESHRESHIFDAGDRLVVADMGKAKVGMSVCYDLRFPHLYRDMAKQGAQILSVPAAFTVPTGRAHWEVLLRARAIETGCFVVAAGQCGGHEGVRDTYGHSMIVNPWGEVLALCEDGVGFIVSNIDLDEVEKAQAAIPALQHDREYRI